MSSLRRLLFPVTLLTLFSASVSAQIAVSLIPNTGMELDADGDDWPDGWPRLKSGTTWESEEGNRFIRLHSVQPGELFMMYSEIGIPEGTTGLEFTWRQRISDLKPGKQPWFDARIMMDFMDANRAALAPSPKPQASRKDTAGWELKTFRFIVPDGARILKFMPALFQVERGTYDLDDIALIPIDGAPIAAAEAEAAAARARKLAETTAALQAKAASTLAATGNLLSNGDMEIDKNTDNWPDDWGKPTPGITSEIEDGKRFLRLKSIEPDKMLMTFRSVVIPADAKALELSVRWRITELKVGPQPWFDARIMMDVKDAEGRKLKPSPPPIVSRGNTKDGAWAQKNVSFLLPEGAVVLDLMPALFNVKHGVIDLDDIVVKPSDPAPLLAQQKVAAAAVAKTQVPVEEPRREKWPVELRVSGNRLVDPSGKEVWLQGVSIPSLDWNVLGEQIQLSTVTAIEHWKSNVIRLPVLDDYWFGLKGQTDGGQAYRDIVDQVIVLAANRGAYVVLDLHRYRAPRPEYLKFWTDAATRYKNHPAVLFDLINEPHGTTWELWRNGGFVEEKKKLGDEDAFLTEEEKKRNKHGFMSPGMQTMIDTVRATGAKNIVVAGGLDYAYDLEGITRGFALEDKTGNGIMYASHVYPWKRAWQRKFLDAAALHPILLAEVGADSRKMDFMPHDIQEDAETWVPEMLGLIQKHRLNWTAWSFHPGASPRMLLDWSYTPTPFWGQQAKDALAGRQFEVKRLR
jgi:hypothetical protein